MDDSCYDFRNMPNKAFYHFDDDVCLEVADGQFIEVPITSMHLPILLFLYDALSRIVDSKRKPYSDGTHFRTNRKIEKKTIWKKFREKIDGVYRTMCNFSFLSVLSRYYFYLKLKHGIICFIDHPKDVCSKTIYGMATLPKGFESISYVDLINK